MANRGSELSDSMQRAIALFQQGATVEAEETMLAWVEETRRRFGGGSPELACAQNELGSILMNVGQPARAIEAFRRACEGPMPSEEAARRDRLTFLMNLGSMLERAGELKEAEAVLRRGLEGRQAFYGRQHAGYAFGLEPLASVLLRQGRAVEALPLLEEAIDNFWRNGHERVAGALVLRAEAMALAGVADEPFADLDGLPSEVIAAISRAAIARVGAAPLVASRAVFAALLPVLTESLGEVHEATINALVAVTNVERRLGDARDDAIRRAALRRLIEIHDRRGDSREALVAAQGYAVSFDSRTETNQMVEAYRSALARAQGMGDGRSLSGVHRNFGLALAEAGLRTDAEAHLRAAVAAAADDRAMLGKAEIALAIFLQHGGQAEPARPLLISAIARLEPSDPDSLCGRAHLNAIDGRARTCCGSADREQAMCDAFRELVLGQLPGDLFNHLDIRLEDNNFKLDMRLAREPTSEEIEHMNRVINHVHHAFRERLVG